MIAKLKIAKPSFRASFIVRNTQMAVIKQDNVYLSARFNTTPISLTVNQNGDPEVSQAVADLQEAVGDTNYNFFNEINTFLSF